MTCKRRTAARAALSTLAILQTVMLAALYAGVPPHPPSATPLFAMAPFLAMSLSTAAAGLAYSASANLGGRIFGALAALLALVSFGPQKYFDAQLPEIWPAVVTGQFAAGVLLVLALHPARTPRQAK